MAAGLNIGKTLYVCLALAVGAVFFSKDAEELVIIPIEKMLNQVKKLTKDPIAAMQISARQSFRAATCEPIPKRKRLCISKPNKLNIDYETALLEQTITKIGILLALGFGEAGSSVIATNITTSGQIDTNSKGSKVHAIFGFCDIRNFTDTTEVLQEEVMMFVNEIALIVHSVVEICQGSANKNIGDAFLLV